MGNAYEVNTYEGAGHAFLRNQSGQNGANLRAAQKAWPRTIEFFRENLEPVGIRRAEQGDLLTVDIQDIAVSDRGFKRFSR